MLSFLGLKSLKQLENSFTVDQHVKVLLEQGKLSQAIHLCRMAKNNGSVGMNQILQYLVKKGDHNTANQVFNNMKKWGCTPTERTPVILTKYAAGSTKTLKQTEVQKLLQTYEHSMAKARTASAKLILSNALLENLARNSSVTYAFAMYNDIPSSGRFSRDTKTYTTMLNMIAHQPTPLTKEITAMRKEIWNEVQKREAAGELVVDSILVDAYSNSLALQTDPKYYKTLLELKEQYFSENTDAEPEDSKKFPFTARQFDILLKSAGNTGQFQQAISLYESVQTSSHVKLDLANYHSILRIAHKVKDAPEVTKKLFDRILTDYRSGNKDVSPTALTIHLVWRNYLLSKHKDIDLNGVEKVLQEVLPELEIPINDMILSSYIAFYLKVFSSSFGRRPGRAAGLRAVQVISDNLSVISDVSPLQKNPQRIKKALLGASNVCDYTMNHPDRKGVSEEDVEWVGQVKSEIQGLLKIWADNFGKTPDPFTPTPKSSRQDYQSHDNNRSKQDDHRPVNSRSRRDDRRPVDSR